MSAPVASTFGIISGRLPGGEDESAAGADDRFTQCRTPSAAPLSQGVGNGQEREPMTVRVSSADPAHPIGAPIRQPDARLTRRQGLGSGVRQIDESDAATDDVVV